MSDDAIIIGASHAGVQTAVSLRQAGWQGGIRLFSAEDALPYNRPPLSKAFLAGDKSEGQLLLRAPEFYRDQEISLHLGEPVTAIDAAARRVTTAAGQYPYSRLVLATGSRARGLQAEGNELAGIFTLRTLSDARVLKEALASAGRVVIVGGGFIGLEFASTAAKLGKETYVLEAEDALLLRALPRSVGTFIHGYHADKGVHFRFGAKVASFEGSNGRVCAIKLMDGTRMEADLVLVGVGGDAELSLANSIGLPVAAGGAAVDEHGMAVDGIYVVGDAASFRNAFCDAPMRVESVQNAVDQAKAAAAHMTGGHAPLRAVPWFWTDQCDLKVQMAGLSREGAVELVRGRPSVNGFTVLQLIGSRLVAAYSVNRAGDHMAARTLIAEGTELDLARAADVDIPLMQSAKLTAA